MRRSAVWIWVGLLAVGCDAEPLVDSVDLRGGACAPSDVPEADPGDVAARVTGERDALLTWEEPGLAGEVPLLVALHALEPGIADWSYDAAGDCVPQQRGDAWFDLQSADGAFAERVPVAYLADEAGVPSSLSGVFPLARLEGGYQPTSFKPTDWDEVWLRVDATLLGESWVGAVEVRATRQGSREGVGEGLAGRIARFE